jgi:hypothetical protein
LPSFAELASNPEDLATGEDEDSLAVRMKLGDLRASRHSSGRCPLEKRQEVSLVRFPCHTEQSPALENEHFLAIREVVFALFRTS